MKRKIQYKDKFITSKSTILNFIDSLFLFILSGLFLISNIGVWCSLLFLFFELYVFSFLFLKRVYFFEDYLLLVYPTRFFKREIKINYKNIKKVKLQTPRGSFSRIYFALEGNLSFSYQDIFFNNLIPILKLMKKKDVKIVIPNRPNMKETELEIKNFNPESDEIKY